MNLKADFSARPRNAILAALPTEIYATLQPHLCRAEIECNQTILETGGFAAAVYFPENTAISLMGSTADGHSIEIGTISADGCLGLAELIGGDKVSAARAVALGKGLCLKIGLEIIKPEFERSESLRALILRGLNKFVHQISVNGGGVVYHPLESRLARLLLHTSDLRNSLLIKTSHELIGLRLGVHRPSVTAALAKFRELGLIASGREKITILKRAELEAFACECYRTIRNAFPETNTF